MPAPSPPVLAAPTLPSWPRPRPNTCSHTRACQAWPCSLQTWRVPGTRRHTLTHSWGLRPSAHHWYTTAVLAAAFTTPAERPGLGPGPPPLWASSPPGTMNNSLFSLWASNIYPLRFPARRALGVRPGPGPAFSVAPPSASLGHLEPRPHSRCLQWLRAAGPGCPGVGEAISGRRVPLGCLGGSSTRPAPPPPAAAACRLPA